MAFTASFTKDSQIIPTSPSFISYLIQQQTQFQVKITVRIYARTWTSSVRVIAKPKEI